MQLKCIWHPKNVIFTQNFAMSVNPGLGNLFSNVIQVPSNVHAFHDCNTNTTDLTTASAAQYHLKTWLVPIVSMRMCVYAVCERESKRDKNFSMAWYNGSLSLLLAKGMSCSLWTVDLVPFLLLSHEAHHSTSLALTIKCCSHMLDMHLIFTSAVRNLQFLFWNSLTQPLTATFLLLLPFFS